MESEKKAIGSLNSTDSALKTTSLTSFMVAKKRIGGKDAPVDYSVDERVFCAGDTAADKAAAKLEVLKSLRSRILSTEKPLWNPSTSNWDNVQLTGKCYKRTNVNAERNRAHMFSYNYRAEKLPKKNPTRKPRSNRFNVGLLEVALKDEYAGDAFGDKRVMNGIAKCTEELPTHPALSDAQRWDQSFEKTRNVRKEQFVALEAARQINSEKWRQKLSGMANYKSPEQLSKEVADRKRQEKQEKVAARK